MLIVRFIVSPSLLPGTVDVLRRFAAESLLACVSDADVNATVVSLRTSEDRVTAATRGVAEVIGAAHTAGRAFRLELQHDDPATFFTDDMLRAIAVDVHGVLRCSIYVAKRSVPVSDWAKMRPMGWGAAGLTLGNASPVLPFGGSEALGLAIEAGGQTTIVKVKLTGSLDASRASNDRFGGGWNGNGFSEVAAYPLGNRKDASAILILELGDLRRSPLHRALAVIEIEAKRFGASLGLGALLSNAPLALFTDALKMHMGLAVDRGQVIETHLPGAMAQK